jgi:hypothetical protein
VNKTGAWTLPGKLKDCQYLSVSNWMKGSNDQERPPGGTPHEGGHDVTPHDRDQESDRKRTAPHRWYVPCPSRLRDPPDPQDRDGKEEPQ